MSRYRPDIQGLRAIAVLAVMAFHLNPGLLSGGFIGVDVFLVVSGFLITSILLHKKDNVDCSLPATLKYFYVSRFKRIVPAYFVTLVVVALVAAVFFIPEDFDTFKDGLKNAVWFNSNSYFASFGDYFAPANHEQPLLHTWSLAVEIQFYLFIPFVILLLPNRFLKWVLVALLLGLTALAEFRLRVQGIEQATYYSLYARLPEFLAGGLAAMYVKSPRGKGSSKAWVSGLGLSLIVLSAMFQPDFGAFPGTAVLLPVAGSVLLLVKPAQGWIGRLLSSATLVWVGTLSYSLYLWHWPVLAFLRYYSGAEVLGFGLSLVFIVLTLLLSLISYYCIEQAFQTKRTTKKQALRWVLLVATVFGTSQAMAKVNAVFTPGQLPIEYRRYADLASICHGKIVGECLQGDLNSAKEVLVLGDSHAAMLNHFFDYLGKKLKFKARIITASSCVTMPGFDYERITEWARQPCIDQIKAAMPYLTKTKIVYLAGVWNTQTTNDAFNKALVRFLEESSDNDIKILSQIPRFNRDVARARRFLSIGLQSDIQRDPSYQVANQYLSELADRYGNVVFVSLDKLSIFNDAPYFLNSLIYKDEHHINQVGALLYAKAATKSFQSLKKQDKQP
ncbi:acyltransferase [bacterium]|nr:acyltransferase [bacterium]